VAGGQLVKLGSFNRSTIAVEDVFADMSGWMYGWLFLVYARLSCEERYVCEVSRLEEQSGKRQVST